MKKSILKTVLLVLLFLGLLAIAIPTISFKLGDEYKRIRGIDPKDFSKDFVIPEWTFRPSLDLQGGKVVTFNVNMDNVEKAKRKEELAITKDIIFSRLQNSGIFNFEFNSLVNEANDEYKLVLKYPNNISDDLIQVIITPGTLGFYADDSLNSATNPNDPTATQDKPYGDRILTSLQNSDIEAVKIVSDARCYFNDSKAPRNYCLAIQFKEASASKFHDALYNNPTPKVPLLLTIDGALVAVQTGGQIFNPTVPGRELLLFPVVNDDKLSTSIVGSLMNTIPLRTIVEQEQINEIKPLLQEDIVNVVKISLLVAFVMGDVLLLVYFRKRGIFAVVASVLFLITNIAVMKMFVLILDLPLIFGFMLAYALFMALVISLIFKIRTESKGGLLPEEVLASLANYKSEYRNATLLIVLVSFVMGIYGTIFAGSVLNGFSFGILLGLIIFYYVFPVLLPIIFLQSKKWQIW